MEDFSKFFDNIMSGNKNMPVSTKKDVTENTIDANNNDNIIYNNIYNNRSGESKTNFPSEDYYLICNEIILASSQLHNKIFDSLTIPYAFIEFYFEQLKNNKELQSSYLRKFFILFENKKSNVANAITIFTKIYKNLAEFKYIKKPSLFSKLSAGYYLDINKSLAEKIITYNPNIDNNLQSAIKEIRDLIDEINNTQESLFKYNYLNYLSDSQNKSANKDNATANHDNETMRKRRIITPPKQEQYQKVSNISLPKLKLGKQYITSLTHSRIDSAHFAWKFMDPSSAYILIKKYRFVYVKYTKGFETKRKSLFEVKKSAFDLF